jgi:putative membrane protein
VLQADRKEAIVARVGALERATGAQVVTAVVARVHPWAEVAWAAFALAASLAGLAVVLLDRFGVRASSGEPVLVAVAIVLLAGATSAALALVAPPYARLFLRAPQRDGAVHRCARLAFHDHGLAATRGRLGVLILVACFERRVEVLADTGYAGLVAPAEWDSVVAATAERLREGDVAAALLAGLSRTEALLVAHGFRGGGANELPDAPLELTAS